MKNLILSLLILYSMFLMTACPKESAVKNAAKASYSLSGLTVDIAVAAARAYNAQIITLDTKDKIAGYLKTISIGGKRFNNTLLIFARQSGPELPEDRLAVLNKIFSDEVVAPFLEVLQSLKILPASRADYLRTAINALRAAVLVISSGFTAVGIENRMEEIKSYA